MIDENQLIAVTPDVDYRDLPSQPSPEDWFLVSRVSGRVTVKDLCVVSGLGKAKTIAAIERLLTLGLLQAFDENGRPVAPPAPKNPRPAAVEPAAPNRIEQAEPNRTEQARRPAPVFADDDDLFEPDSPVHAANIAAALSSAPAASEEPIAVAARSEPVSEPPRNATPPAEERRAERSAPVAGRGFSRFPADFDAWELPDQLVEEGLPRDVQKEIHFVYEHLRQVDFYQLFGVTEDADRKEIRSAYFAMSKRFHPDKFFRGEASEASRRVEEIFKFVTKGYDTLSKKRKREEYDRALREHRAQEEVTSREEQRKREMAAEMLQRRARQLEQQGDFLRAAGEYRKVATLRRDPDALTRAAELLLRANRSLDEASQLARAAARELPEDPGPRLVLGQIFEKNDMLVEALAAFEEALELKPSDPSIRIHVERVRSQLR